MHYCVFEIKRYENQAVCLLSSMSPCLIFAPFFKKKIHLQSCREIFWSLLEVPLLPLFLTLFTTLPWICAWVTPTGSGNHIFAFIYYITLTLCCSFVRRDKSLGKPQKKRDKRELARVEVLPHFCKFLLLASYPLLLSFVLRNTAFLGKVTELVRDRYLQIFVNFEDKIS